MRYTFIVPETGTYLLKHCEWNPENEEFECIVVNDDFTDDDNGTHDEMAGSLDCNASGPLTQITLGAASQVYQLSCAACTN